ncbi:DegV family protein [Natranaerobius trueperi]|uniref:EDD domain protein n=1 Tax=Natranaerobius trueperi TaxID=759412 RepID=A0A226C191_9FIRM|nr:DegV family protein [Natranaerobius trueperi]OWZ84177.1 EDD domain protein [Natranaerobius trueperi]
MTVHIVTDSTCDLPNEILEELNIHYVPLNVHFGEEGYKDKLELEANDFYKKLIENKESIHPSTSQPSPGDFVSKYQEIANEEDVIISIHLSSKLSGTYQSANLAKDMLPNYDIRVVDSETASIAMGLLVIKAALEKDKGASSSEILEKIEKSKNEITLNFLVDTLEYLQKGGRIGKAQALVGTLLDIKPILTLTDGQITPLEKVRNKKKAIRKMLDFLYEEKGDQPVTVGVLYSGSKEERNFLIDQIKQKFNCKKIIDHPFGSVIGVHVGPDALGVCLL